jgi:hypothetical protein
MVRPQRLAFGGCLFVCGFFAAIAPAGNETRDIAAVVEGYLKSTDWQQRLDFVHDADRLKDVLRHKYERSALPLLDVKVLNIQEMAGLKETFLVKATWKEKNKNARFANYYVVRKAGGRFKMDWPASVGYNAKSLKSLVASHPKEAEQLRLIARLDSSYRSAYAAAAPTHYCILLKEDNPLQTVHGFIAKSSPDGKKLYDLLRARKEAGDRVIVEIRLVGPSGDKLPPGSRQVAITRVVSTTWVEPEKGP